MKWYHAYDEAAERWYEGGDSKEAAIEATTATTGRVVTKGTRETASALNGPTAR